MATATLDAPATEAPTSAYSFDSYMERRGITLPESNDSPAPTPEAPKPDAPATPEAPVPTPEKQAPETPAVPAPEGKKSRPEAEMRVRLKQLQDERDAWTKEKEEWLREKEELIALRDSKIPELETTATTYKTTADSYAKDLEEFRKSWKNEREKEWTEIANELPEYKEAMQKLESSWLGLFPRNIADPASGEAEIRFNPANMSPENSQAVDRLVKQWADWEYNDKVTDARRSDAQHIIVSLMAKSMGVSSEHMDQKELDGKMYDVIRPGHPVYGHLINKIPGLVESRIQAANLQGRAQQESKTMAAEAIRKRQENRRESFKAAGFGLSGEELKTRALREPQNPVIQALSLLGDDEELRGELQTHLEQEAITDGFWRPHFTLPEDDPKAHDQAARAHMSRIGNRPVLASIGQVLLKQASKLKAERDELRAKIAKLEEENNRYALQDEPGVAAGGGASGGKENPALDGLDPYTASYMARRGLV